MRLVFGVGVYDGIGDTVTNPYYCTWKRMLQRCYSEKFHLKNPTYIGHSVCKDWLRYSLFEAWMVTQNWEGLELDKDLRVMGNTEYSPEACIFVPSRINSLLQDCGSRRGDLPLGVHLHKVPGTILRKPYRARTSSLTGMRHLGYFTTPEQAHEAWVKGKSEAILETLEWWKYDPQVAHSFDEMAYSSLKTFVENKLGFKKEFVNAV